MPTPMSAATMFLMAACRLSSIAIVGRRPASAKNSSISRRVLPPRSPRMSRSPASANALMTFWRASGWRGEAMATSWSRLRTSVSTFLASTGSETKATSISPA